MSTNTQSDMQSDAPTNGRCVIDHYPVFWPPTMHTMTPEERIRLLTEIAAEALVWAAWWRRRFFLLAALAGAGWLAAAALFVALAGK